MVSSHKRCSAARRTAAHRIASPARASLDRNSDSDKRHCLQQQEEVNVSRREAIALPAAVLAAVAVTATTAGPAAAGAPPALECEGELQTAASGLQFCEATVGTGREPTKGTTIKAHYTGTLTDGRVFDSSYTRGSPLQFKIGVGQVIRCEDGSPRALERALPLFGFAPLFFYTYPFPIVNLFLLTPFHTPPHMNNLLRPGDGTRASWAARAFRP